MEHNVRGLRKKLKNNTDYMAVIKGNGWGCGLLPAARIFSSLQVDWLGVTKFKDAVKIRNENIDLPILILNEIPTGKIEKSLEFNLRYTLFNPQMIELMDSICREKSKRVKVHLLLNTGLNRWGIKPDNLDRALDLFKNSSYLELEGVYSHFMGEYDFLDAGGTRAQKKVEEQFELFCELLNYIKINGINFKYKHIANTPAAIDYPHTHMDLARIGMGNYGLYPGSRFEKLISLKLVPAFKTEIAHINRVKKDESVGYGGLYTAPKNTQIGIIPVGYAGGLPDSLVGNEIIVNSKRCQVIAGAMENFFIDLEENSVEVGDEVIIFGGEKPNKISLKEIAEKCSRTKGEFLAQLDKDIERVIIE